MLSFLIRRTNRDYNFTYIDKIKKGINIFSKKGFLRGGHTVAKGGTPKIFLQNPYIRPWSVYTAQRLYFMYIELFKLIN